MAWFADLEETFKDSTTESISFCELLGAVVLGVASEVTGNESLPRTRWRIPGGSVPRQGARWGCADAAL